MYTLGAVTVIVLIANDRQIDFAREPVSFYGRSTLYGRDRRCTLRFYGGGENGTLIRAVARSSKSR